MKIQHLGLLCLAALCCLFNCQDKPEKNEEMVVEEEMNIDSPIDTTHHFSYQQSLDPLMVGEAFLDQKFVDTLLLQMYKTTIKPGDSMALHQHPDHTVYVLKGGKLKLSFNGQEPVEMDFVEGTGFMSGPASDYAVNIGDTDVSFLIHEIYRPRGSATNLDDVDY